MTQAQIIPPNWHLPVEEKIAAMESANLEMLRHAPGEEYDRLADIYESVCRDFLDHLRSEFGSVQGFNDFLRSDVREKLSRTNASLDLVDQDDSWAIDDLDNFMTAEQASAAYRIKYRDLIEGMAFNKAFLHQTPGFEL